MVESHWILVELPSDRLERFRNYLLEELERVSDQQDAQIKRARATIKKTEQQRRKLADLVVDGAIPPDIAREKQEQLQARLARATRDLQAQQIEADQAKTLVLDALDLAGNCARAYEVADPEARRQWNQTFFQRLLIEPDHILAADMQPAYATLMVADAPGAEHQQSPAPMWLRGSEVESVDLGSSNDVLVVLLEQLSNPQPIGATGPPSATRQ